MNSSNIKGKNVGKEVIIVLLIILVTLLLIWYILSSVMWPVETETTPIISLSEDVDINGNYVITINDSSPITVSFKHTVVELIDHNDNPIININITELNDDNSVHFSDNDDNNKLSKHDTFIISNGTWDSGYVFHLTFLPTGGHMCSIYL